ncbi:hypothetical protein AAD001_09180 [Colwelliaceae bacterium 6471]
MSTKKHKPKKKYKNQSIKRSSKRINLISQYPRTFLIIGIVFIVIAGFLLVTGMQNNAKFGLALLSLIVGAITVIMANFSLAKKNVNG